MQVERQIVASLPSLNLNLDAEKSDPYVRAMKKKYCGPLAKSEFFSYYKQVRQ